MDSIAVILNKDIRFWKCQFVGQDLCVEERFLIMKRRSNQYACVVSKPLNDTSSQRMLSLVPSTSF